MPGSASSKPPPVTPATQSVHGSVRESVNGSVTQSIHQSFSQRRATDEGFWVSVHQPRAQSVHGSVCQSVSQSVHESEPEGELLPDSTRSESPRRSSAEGQREDVMLQSPLSFPARGSKKTEIRVTRGQLRLVSHYTNPPRTTTTTTTARA